MTKKLKKKMNQKNAPAKNSNANYFLIGLAAFLVIIFVFMTSAVLKKDSPTGSTGGSSSELAQIESRIATRLDRLQQNPDDLPLIENLGNDYYGAGFAAQAAGNIDQAKFFWEEAIYYYLQILEQDPTNINVRVDMATISWRADRNDFAEEHFLIAIEQQPDFLFARTNLGNFYAYAAGDLEAAIEQWEVALTLNPNTETRVRLNNQIDEAKSYLQQ